MTESELAPAIRGAQPADVPHLVELLIQGALVDGTEDPDRAGTEDPDRVASYQTALVEIQATTGCVVLVAELDDAVVGMCQLIVFRHFQAVGGRCAEIESVHVHPHWRGRGIGGRLVEEAVARAAASDCYRIQLTSNKARADAHRFYEGHGFVASHEGYKRAL
ncbi:MAG TPA: GNAT family N-acetyltransferase [Acidimicrobiales bacterium]